MTHHSEVEGLVNGDVVICDGMYTGKIGHIIGIGSTEHSIKLLIDNEIERYEPDYALITITDDNKKGLELLIRHLTHSAKEYERGKRDGTYHAWMDAIELSDKLEESNTKFDEWRAFKGFRNALHDKIATLPQTDVTKN